MLIEKVKKKFFILGFRPFCLCIFYKIYFIILAIFFKIDKWHINTPFHCRSYKQKIVEISNDLRPSTIVEVGCGAGDIISRVKGDSKYGYDQDTAVINFARFLDKNTNYQIGSFDELNRTKFNIDLLIIINWLHGVDEAYIKSNVINNKILNRTKFIFLDKVNKKDKSFHDFEDYFKGFAKKIFEFQDPEDSTRSLILLSINK